MGEMTAFEREMLALQRRRTVASERTANAAASIAATQEHKGRSLLRRVEAGLQGLRDATIRIA